jgi:hypothetical protein
MAIKQGATTVAEVEQEQTEQELRFKEVDINDTSLYEGDEQEVDAKEDWQAKAAPPPKGRYRLQLFPTSKETITSFQQGTKTGYEENPQAGAYYVKELMCKIVSEDKWKGSIVGVKFSTGVPRGKKTSTMLGIMLLAGVQIKQGKMTDRQVASMFSKFLAKEPILSADCDWQAWDNMSKDKDNPFGLLLLKGMDNFPKKADGSHSHIVKNKKGQEFVASLKIIKWVPKGATAATPAKPVAVASKPVAVIKKVEPVEDVVQLDDEVGGVEMGDDGEVILDA